MTQAFELWTDGSARPTNPGPGGWAVVDLYSVRARGSDPNATNIQMEGLALLNALYIADTQPVTIYSDSQVWIMTLKTWARGWEVRGWRKHDGKVPENLDLVKALHSAYAISKANLVWVKGHAGDWGNVFADRWAEVARREGLTANDRDN